MTRLGSPQQAFPVQQALPAGLVPMSAIRRVARQIVKQFQPEQITLFGSYAYGKPNHESDVDLFVLMPASDVIGKANRIENALQPPFRIDVEVRTPTQVRWRIRDGDWFLREVVGKGKILYARDPKEARRLKHWAGRFFLRPPQDTTSPRPGGTMKKVTAEWVQKAEADWAIARRLRTAKWPLTEVGCFHCQQTAEKYFKALLQERSQAVPRTHGLDDLLDLLIRHDSTLGRLRRGLKGLTAFAVQIRYPGRRANEQKLRAALRLTERLRREIRTRLGIRTRRPRKRKSP